MTLRVIAVVVSHDKPDFLAQTLHAISEQTRKPELIVVVDSSKIFAPIEAVAEGASVDKLIRISDSSPKATSTNSALLVASEALLGAEPDLQSDWFWILQADTAPEPTALELLLQTIERSPSVTIAAPKLVEWQNPRQIIRLGMTLSPTGQLVDIAANQLDQSQHDEVEDVLAVGFSGTLLRVDTFQELGGFDDSAPGLAVDYDFSIRARLGGHRVVVVPSAKVRQAQPSAHRLDEVNQLDQPSALATRKAEIHLRLVFLPTFVALAYWLLLPLSGVAISIFRLAQKQPNRIGAELGAAAWGFLTIGRRWASRRLTSARQRRGFAKLSRLRSSWSQLRAEARRSAPTRPAEAAAAEPSFEAKSFSAAGGIWLVAALLALSFALWPKLPAVSGGSLIPLSDDWFQLFGRAGAAYQALGNGFIAPSDPQVWLLSAIGAITFWQPSLAVAALLFCSKALAFVGFWHLASRVTNRAAIKNITAACFALFPLFLTVQLQGRFSAVVLVVAAPWLCLTVARLAGLGLNSVPPSAQKSWSLVGLSGLLLAAVGAAAPNTIPVLLVSLLLVAALRFRRAGYLIWVGLPLATLFTPLVAHFLARQPLGLLLDPGVAMSQPSFSAIFSPQPWMLVAPALVVSTLVALLGLLLRRWGVALWVWLLVLLAVAFAWFNSKLVFESDFGGQGSAFALLMLATLGLFVLVALTLDQWAEVGRLSWLRVIASLSLIGLIAVPGAVLAAVEKSDLSWTDGRVVPSIVAAEAKQGSQLRLLTIRPAGFSDSTPTFSAKLISGDGLHLEDSSVAYAFAGSDTAKSGLAKQTGQVVANLVSGNGIDLRAALKNALVGYVLLPPDTSTAAQELGVSLDATAELESVGSTDFGQLWRVRDPATSATVKDKTPGIAAASGFWSITKITQLAVLLGFTLLALPSGRRRRSAAESDIFGLGNDDSGTDDSGSDDSGSMDSSSMDSGSREVGK